MLNYALAKLHKKELTKKQVKLICAAKTLEQQEVAVNSVCKGPGVDWDEVREVAEKIGGEVGGPVSDLLGATTTGKDPQEIEKELQEKKARMESGPGCGSGGGPIGDCDHNDRGEGAGDAGNIA